MDLAGKTALVTGGCGLIGSTLCDLLVSRSVKEVRVLDNLSRGRKEHLQQAQARGPVILIEQDIRRFADILPAFSGVDVVFHLAAIRITACAENWRECQEVLVDGTFNVAEACVRTKVSRLIAASSASVYGMADEFPTPETARLQNRTMYGAAKIANETLYRSINDMTGLPYVALRYFNVYGPRMDVHGKYTEVLVRWMDALEQGHKPKIFGDGSQTMDLIYVEDVARATLLAAESSVSDEVINVGTGIETSLRGLLEEVAGVTGHRIEPEILPERAVNPVRRRLADTRKARELLGFEAQTPLSEGLRRFYEWRRP